jgi:diphthamide synthase (EF-2-diphthine--ammonia ligase)
MSGLFPIWQRDTKELARTFIALGFQAVLVCVDTKKLPESFAGRQFDTSLLNDLPDGIDPCGENGEFHTFVFDGPIFSKPVPVRCGEIANRDGFIFCDLLVSA